MKKKKRKKRKKLKTSNPKKILKTFEKCLLAHMKRICPGQDDEFYAEEMIKINLQLSSRAKRTLDFDQVKLEGND